MNLSEKIIDMYLLALAKSRSNTSYISFEDLVAEEGFSMEEIDALSQTI